jgi:hypothetical protein
MSDSRLWSRKPVSEFALSTYVDVEVELAGVGRVRGLGAPLPAGDAVNKQYADGLRDIPFLVPPAGEHVMTTMGSGSNLSTIVGAANRMEIFCWMPRRNLVIDAVSINVTTLIAASLAKVVVYGSDANGWPDARLAETADIDCGVAGVRTTPLALSLVAGQTYWLGLRYSATQTLSAWLATAVPDINGGAPTVNARKGLRRTLTYATAAPANWGYLSTESVNINPTAIWLRMAP